MVDATDTTLHEDPGAFDSVGVNVSLNVDPDFMVETSR